MHTAIFNKLIGIHQLILTALLLELCACNTVCDRRPLGITTDPLPPDNQFLIDIDDIRESLYIPNQQYTVRLHSRENESKFIAFSIWLQPDSVPNKNNPRKPIPLRAGRLVPSPEFTDTVYHHTCNDTIIQADITAKNAVEALWTAPDKDNKCVTIFAVVAVKPDVWYSFEGPLSKRLCEDTRKADDMQPMENDRCQVCEDARYELTFEGRWSYNTHAYMFPEAKELARFSDVVGASHSKKFIMYKNNAEASEGLALLAVQGNTTGLELEILKELGDSVRTVIKATAPPQPNQATITSFRTTRQHHLVSLATAMLPSPDWFLGVSNLELCDARNNIWAEKLVFNLYPLDAGRDKGVSFESANEPTLPPQPIMSADISQKISKEDRKPFARLLFTLVRTYNNPNCIEDTTTGTTEGVENGYGVKVDDNLDNNPETEPPFVLETTSEMTPVDPTATPTCPISEWGEWDECAGECINQKVRGYHMRSRKYLSEDVSQCSSFPLHDFGSCEDECEEDVPVED